MAPMTIDWDCTVCTLQTKPETQAAAEPTTGVRAIPYPQVVNGL